MHRTRRADLDWTLLDAPVPTESGEYPIGVFSDAEIAMSAREVDETIASFSVVARSERARLGRRRS